MNKCINNCYNCKLYKCRCDSCMALIEKNKKWYCDEYGAYCETIAHCDEFINNDNK